MVETAEVMAETDGDGEGNRDDSGCELITEMAVAAHGCVLYIC